MNNINCWNKLEIIERIYSPYSASWVVWVLFFLLLIGVFNHSLWNSLRGGWQAMFSYVERRYGYVTDLGSKILSFVLQIGVVGLAVYLLLYSAYYSNGAFTFINYLKVTGVVVLLTGIQLLFIRIVGRIFLSPRHLSAVQEQSEYIHNVMSAVLWFVVLFSINCSSPLVTYILCCAAGIFFSVAMMTKGIQMFYNGVLSLLYIVLYFISLEVIPVCGMLLWSKDVI